ncbi:unnamed protein product, partial [Nesidiocoris tenuis]
MSSATATVHQCPQCQIRFGTKPSLSRHLTEDHKCRSSSSRNASIKCPMCQLPSENYASYEQHLEYEHNFVSEKEILNFETRDAFQNWKLSVEDRDTAKFVIRTSKNLQSKQVAYYRCHRSGPARYRRDEKSRKRLVKVQGSCKTNTLCPALIKASFHPDGKVSVEFRRSHFGHAAEPVHLTIPSEVKESIAEKIRNKVPVDQILEEARNGSLEDVAKAKRVHRLTAVDLRNIARKFDIDKSLLRRTPQAVKDWDNLDYWVALKEREATSGPSPILFYKPIHRSSSEYPKLGNDDFFIAFMSIEQEKILCEGNFETVCLLSSCGVNPSAYRLATIAVLDEEKRQIPCAYFITNRMDTNMMEIFLTLVKSRVGVLRPTVFLSEDGNLMQEVWESVMGNCAKSFYCPWYVLQTWENTLLEMVVDAEVRKTSREKLRLLLTESNTQTFPNLLMLVANDLVGDERTAEFGGYFIREFVENGELWACCYSKACGIDITSHLNCMHEEIERVIGQGKPIKKLQITIQALLSLAESKLHEPTEILVRETMAARLIKNLRRRHKVAVSMDVKKVSPVAVGTWEVFSSSKSSFTVSLVEPLCTCSTKCVYCKACIHQYVCSCVDARIKGNMCKHIHLVCLFTSSLRITEVGTADPPILPMDVRDKSTVDSLTIDLETINQEEGILIVDALPQDKTAPESVSALKHELIGNFFSALSTCDFEDEFRILQKHLSRAQEEISSNQPMRPKSSTGVSAKRMTVILKES